MKVFISGPMTGIDDFNREAFNDAARKITKKGHVALNPAVLPDGLLHREYMKICYAMLKVSNAIYQLPGWEDSVGAKMEYDFAIIMDLKIIGPEEE